MLCGIEIRIDRVVSHPVFIPSRKKGIRHVHRIKLKVIKFNLKGCSFRCMMEFNNSFFLGDNLHTLFVSDHDCGHPFWMVGYFRFRFPFDSVGH